ncbi:PREDICTED: uncharacterized protein LOC107104122 isoform X2 [Cyprinodon variegatus]|uniref:uncharacterized protein LOC107104122 isoform X2 n=1 Tax=Cyprinodon variegatus TaxID=28743 RepID=UPI000742B9B1|nr:PREDICTED: uncharacterized protein LOC107104122 isoform X2 [Cyprinodon variegatus]
MDAAMDIKDAQSLNVLLNHKEGKEDESIDNQDSQITSSLENYLDLKICILEDWTIEAISDQVDEDYPVHELRCPSGLREEDFLRVLRITFPLLAANIPFESFIADSTKRLQPLKVDCFTPEQICRAAGNSALYIRIKCPPEEEAGCHEEHAPIDNESYGEDASLIQTQSPSDTRNEAPPLPAPPALPSPQKNPVDQKSRPDTIVLSVRVLDNSLIEVVTKSVLRRCKPRKLRCPRGMQEAELLKLLRSTFPKLRTEKPLEYFVTDSLRKLLPLKLEPVTPEGISAAVGDSSLYVRVKKDRSIRGRKKKVNKAADHKEDRNDFSSASNWTAAENLPQGGEADGSINLRIYLLEDSGIENVTDEVLDKYQLHNLRCPPGMSCGDFLKLLRSTFPMLASKTYFETFKSNPDRKLLPLYVNIFTPEQITREAGESALFIRLKPPEDIQVRKRSNPDDARPSLRKKSPDHKKVDDKDAPMSLHVCLLESDVDVLKPQALNKHKIHELKCPWGLQEKEFMDLLRSTFSLLAGQAFKVLTLQSGKLLPLKVNRLVPEEIQRAIGSVDQGFPPPVLYIQLPQPPQKEDTKPLAHPSTAYPDIQTLSNYEPEQLLNLKICILDDPKINHITPSVLQKHAIQDFQCPGTLLKAGFLDLLQSKFPKLAGANLDFLVDYGEYMMAINLKNSMAEKMNRILLSARTRVLYIIMKEKTNVEVKGKRSHSSVTDESISSPRQSLKKRRKMKLKSRHSGSHHRNGKSEDDKTEDSEDEGKPEDKKPAKLLAPGSLMTQISSTDNTPPETKESCPVAMETIQIDDDQTDDSEDERLPDNPTLSRLSFMNTQISAYASKETTTKVQKTLPDAKASTQVDDDETEDSEDYDDHDSVNSSQLNSTIWDNEARKNIAKEKPRVSGKEEVKPPEAKRKPNIEEVEILDSEEGDDDSKAESSRRSSLQSQIPGQDVKQNSTTENTNVKQNKINPEAVKTNAPTEQVEISDADGDNEDSSKSDTVKEKKEQTCRVCSLILLSKRLLIRHAWKHLNHKDQLCGVCGMQLDSAVELQMHLQKYQNTHNCKICCKRFISKDGYRKHMRRHKVNDSQSERLEPTQK